MTIPNFSEVGFKEVLKRSLRPARAISDPNYLRGRAQRLRQIDRAFNSPGKHIFIYGDRGVGKTSLAQSAATIHQSSDASPILVACDQYVDFYQLASDMARSCIPPAELMNKPTQRQKIGGSLFGFGHDVEHGIQKGVIPPIKSLNDAVLVLKYLASQHSREPVVILDEFDQIKGNEDKKRFADLIKQVSDQEVGIRFIFCGIGSSLEDLIGIHLSTDRYIAPVPLDPLSADALWEILDTTADELGVKVGHEEKVRIGLISDGFPYYVHLIGEHMFWAMYDDEELVGRVSLGHFDAGIRGAVNEAVGSLKQAYNNAILKQSDDYEEVLWAVADGTIMERAVTHIYEKSYLPIMMQREGREPLTKTKFLQRINKLKQSNHGNILLSNTIGYYRFRENWMRGYVRLKAEEAGTKLGVDHHLAGSGGRGLQSISR